MRISAIAWPAETGRPSRTGTALKIGISAGNSLPAAIIAFEVGVNIQGRGTLDERATKAKRNAGDATTCCYVWNEPCPG